VLADPVPHVLWEALVKFIEIFRDDEPVVPDVSPVNNGDWVGLTIVNRKTGKTYSLIPNCGGIALHRDTSFRKEMNCMRASVGGRNELALRVQRAMALATKKEAEMVVDTVISALEETLLNNLPVDGFTLKLGSFGKFSVRHKPGILRKIPFTGETILTKDRRKITFVSLGSLRRCEAVISNGGSLS
jgi:nucleoid DNA-binding protein